MTKSNEPNKTPDEMLAALVITKLKDKGFIPDKKILEVTNKLVAGTATQDDWKLWIDLSTSKPTEDTNGKN